jgi:hypothetical protein
MREGPGKVSHEDRVRAFVKPLKSQAEKFGLIVQVIVTKDLIQNDRFFTFVFQIKKNSLFYDKP